MKKQKREGVDTGDRDKKFRKGNRLHRQIVVEGDGGCEEIGGREGRGRKSKDGK